MTEWKDSYQEDDNELEAQSADLPEMPALTSFFEPMEIFLHRDALKRAVDLGLRNIRKAARSLPLDAEKQKELELLDAQRVEMLDWIERNPETQIFVALYPITTYENHEKVED